MYNPIYLHKHKFALLLISLLGVGAVNAEFGQLSASIDWFDVFGESCALLLSLVLIGFILSSRPMGSTTNWLYTGLLGFSCATLQDVLDEFFQAPAGFIYADVIESCIMPLALILLITGFVYWRREQQAINQQLRTREHYHREHSALDYTTGLYTALYLQRQIERELTLASQSGKSLALVMVDINRFDRFNQSFGEWEGDRLLRQVADLLVMNLRQQDLVCRYSADRFIILLPEASAQQASQCQRELLGALEHFCFKPSRRHSLGPLSYSATHLSWQSSDEPAELQCQQLLQTLSRQLQVVKASQQTTGASSGAQANGEYAA